MSRVERLCIAYLVIGMLAFGWYAYRTNSEPSIDVVKVRQVPPLVPRPTEVHR